MATLAEIRARLQAMENKGGNSSGSDGAIYPFWNLSEGSSSLIRFLPDGNPNNTFFWAQREMIRLPFAGVKGGDSKSVMVQVPCVEMFGRKDCPVLTQVRPMFKDPSLETIARKYWKKRSYVFQGFVVEDGVKEENAPENPIRRFIIGPQLYQIIQASLMDPELEEVPTHYDLGIDFRVAKTKKGEYSDYSTSKWSRRERALTSEERDAIETHGLLDLTEFLPKEPNEQDLQAIGEMFEASFGGEAYDPERWGNFYKPYGLDTGSTTPAASAPAQAKKPAPAAPAANDDEDDTPFDGGTKSTASASGAPGGAKAEDILAMIRSRKGS